MQKNLHIKTLNIICYNNNNDIIIIIIGYGGQPVRLAHTQKND